MTDNYLSNRLQVFDRSKGGCRSAFFFGLLLSMMLVNGGCGERSGANGQGESARGDQAQAQNQDSVRDKGTGGGATTQVATSRGAAVDQAPGNATVAYWSGGTPRKEIRLPDGTGVVMHAGTVIRLSGTFAKGNRELWMEGEAMFDVAARTGKLFIVHTAYLRIEGLGSRFRVDAKRKQAGEEVDLLSGKLTVTKTYHSDSDNEPETIRTGEMVMINRDIDLMEKEKMDGSELKGWDAVH